MKTIADHMVDVLTERGIKVIGWGDFGLLDECASRCTHTTLMKTHMDARHQRILNALERSDKFEKHYVKGLTAMGGYRLLRQFELIFKEPKPDGGVEEFRSRRESMDSFSRNIKKGLKVSQKTMQTQITI